MSENKREARGRGLNLEELFDHWREEGGEEGIAIAVGGSGQTID